MDKLHLIIKLMGILIMGISSVGVYDARKISKKFFGDANINATVRNLRLVGFLTFIIGCVLVTWG